jgi:hypothetical protein
MKKFRMVIAVTVAVAMMSFGAVACTPADQAQFENNAQNIFATILFEIYISVFCQNNQPCLP